MMKQQTKDRLMICLAGLLAVIATCYLVGCGDAARIIEPEPPKDTTTVVVTGPPAYAVSVPQELVLYVGDEPQQFPTVTVYDSAGTVIPMEHVAIGWRVTQWGTPWRDIFKFTYDESGSMYATVRAVQEGEAWLYPIAAWKEDRSYWYYLDNDGRAKIELKAITRGSE